MDIFKYAKEFNADYYDPHTGNIYKVQNYNKCKKLGIPTEGIEVTNLEGVHIGTVLEK
jgi:hypothetical protein